MVPVRATEERRMFTGSTKNPPAKTPQPERLDEVYAALRRGLQSYLQVHQLELDSLGQQIRENKRNGRLGSLYEQDKQVKAIERFMRRLEFHLSKVEELYDAYCIQRRVRDGASKMVAAFNSATGSREARESLSEANKGFRECTEHMCSLESDLESQMGEFHIKMKGLAGFARLCAGDQYEVLMRYGRQRWRMRGRVEVSSKQVWDSEDYIFLPLVAELLSIKVTELKSLANHVVVGSVSCEMLDLFCPLPQTLAVDINDLGTVKLNLEVTWSPFDKDDQVSSASTVTKRLLSNQSPPDTPSMREQVFYSLLKRQGELDNGTVWSTSSESSDDSSSPALAHHAQRLAHHAPPPRQLSFAPRQSSTSTPSLSSNQGEDEPEEAGAEAGFTQMLGARSFSVPNGHLQGAKSDSHIGGGARGQSAERAEAAKPRSTSYPSVFSQNAPLPEEPGDALALAECDTSEESVSSQEGSQGAHRDTPPRGTASTQPTEGGTTEPEGTASTQPREGGTTGPEGSASTQPREGGTTGPEGSASTQPREGGTTGPEGSASTQPREGGTTGPEGTASTQPREGGTTGPEGTASTQPREGGTTGPEGTASTQPREGGTTGPEGLVDQSSEEHQQESKGSEETQRVRWTSSSSFTQEVETALESFDFLNCSDLDEDEDEEEAQKEQEEEDKSEGEEKGGERDFVEEAVKEQEVGVEKIYSGDSDDPQEGEGAALDILMEAPEGFRNSDEDCCYLSQGSSAESLQEACDVETLGPAVDHDQEEEESNGKQGCPSTTSKMADTDS